LVGLAPFQYNCTYDRLQVYELLAGEPLFPPDGYPELHLKLMELKFREEPPAFIGRAQSQAHRWYVIYLM
jgi:hypothetical protein